MGEAMPDPVFTNEELEALNRDGAFQKRVAEDRELFDLFNPPPDDEDEREQTARSLGMAYRIAGVTVPPPTIGTFRLLSFVGSEFLKAERRFDDIPKEITLALFVLHYGARAVAPVCGQFRFRAALDRLNKQAEKSPEHLAMILDAEAKLSAELGAWDAALARFAATQFRPAGKSMLEIVREIDAYLAAALSGLDNLPQLEPADGKKKPLRHGITTARRFFSRQFGKSRPASASTTSAGESHA